MSNETTDRDPRMDVLARGVDCPRCGAWADTPCVTRRGGAVPTVPHVARVDKAVRLYLLRDRDRHAHRFTFYPSGSHTTDGGKAVCDCGVEGPA